MERNDILIKIQQIFVTIFDNNNILVTEDTSFDEIEEWSSLSHTLLIVDIEEVFGLELTQKEILAYPNIGAMIDNIIVRL